jgi:endonuclease/exonuclease/phosphatase (EEP) superfamily protein YafD
VAWPIVAALAALLVAQLTGAADHVALLVALVVATPVLYLPAWLVAGAAAATRRFVLAAAAGAVVAGHLVLLWPVLPVHDGGSPTGPSLTVATANVLFDNARMRAAAETVLGQGADVVAVEEYSHEAAAAFAVAASRRYPYQLETRSGDASGTALFSRLPLLDGKRLTVGYAAVQAAVRVGGRRVTVLAVHAKAPIGQTGLSAWRGSLRELRRRADAVRGPLVVAGDLNATPYHHAFRELVDGPLDDAAERLGRAWRTRTWRQGGRLGPLALLDHVLVSGGIVPTHLDTVALPGSDHRMVVATLRTSR